MWFFNHSDSLPIFPLTFNAPLWWLLLLFVCCWFSPLPSPRLSSSLLFLLFLPSLSSLPYSSFPPAIACLDAHIQVELSAARAALAAVKAEKEDVLARAEDLEEAAAQAKTEAAAASNDMQRRLQTVEAEREELRQQCSVLQAQVDEHSDLEAQLSSLEEELEEELSNHRKREEELQGQLADLHREAHAQQDEIRHLQRDLAAARARDRQQVRGPSRGAENGGGGW